MSRWVPYVQDVVWGKPLTDDKHLDDAIWKLCSPLERKCDTMVLPANVAKLVFEDELYTKTIVGESMVKALAVIHNGRACFWSNRLRFEADGLPWLTAHRGRAEEDINELRPAEFIKFVQECDKPVIGVPISFEGHANAIIINRVLSTIEHFEPHGAVAQFGDEKNIEAIYKNIKETFVSMLPDYTWVPPDQTCPRLTLSEGTQSLLNKYAPKSKFGGTCVVWSLWYMHVRILFPEVPANELMDKALILAFGEGHVPNANSDTYEDWFSQTMYCNEECQKTRQGVQKLEQFIIAFTQQLISLLDIHEKDGCLVVDGRIEKDCLEKTEEYIQAQARISAKRKADYQAKLDAIDAKYQAKTDALYSELYSDPPQLWQRSRRRSRGRRRTGRRRTGRRRRR